MDGVVILNEFTCLSDVWFVFPLGIGLILVVCLFDAAFKDKLFDAWICGMFAGMFFLLSYCAYCDSNVTRYDALVDPGVSVTEFVDTYQVIERKGDIWVLEPIPKGDDENEEI